MANPEPIPGDPIVSVGKTFADSRWTVTNSWFDWLLALATIVFQSARLLTTVLVPAQAGAIGVTPLIPGKSGSRFLVGVFVRVTQAATTSSSISMSISGIDGVQVYSLATTPIVNGTPSSAWSQVFLVEGSASSLTYSSTYASVGATPMLYEVRMCVWNAS